MEAQLILTTVNDFHIVCTLLRLGGSCEQVVGQDEQQPRKERPSRVSQAANRHEVDIDKVEVTLNTASDAEEERNFEELPLELDSIVLTEMPGAEVAGVTWND